MKKGSEKDVSLDICSMAVRKGIFSYEMAHSRRNKARFMIKASETLVLELANRSAGRIDSLLLLYR